MRARGFDSAVDAVLAADTCSGCGACTRIDPGLEMRLDAAGYARPVRVRATTSPPDAVRTATFDRVCPGRLVEAPPDDGRRRHPVAGAYVSVWEAWAVDPGTRFIGSSGGTLTALTAWLLETAEVSEVVAARADASDPARTTAVVLTPGDDARLSAGSRYAPVSNAAIPVPGTGALVGKPCEVSATRQLAGAQQVAPPLLLSFFCAGVPSQRATETVVRSLNMPVHIPLASVRYRGHGWPGSFTVENDAGDVASASYEESWGDVLGKALQWRCKICPDGLGESADITAGDFWRSDERGFPLFESADGISVLVARTQRGHDILQRAHRAGAVELREVDLADVVQMQPYQVERRTTLLGRLAGATAAGRTVPRYVGFHLVRAAFRSVRRTGRAAAGSFVRSVRRSSGRTASGAGTAGTSHAG